MSSTDVSEAEKAFLEFNWSDERWQSFLKSLFPVPNHANMERWKRKFFRRTIDSRLPVDKDETPSPAPPPPSSSTPRPEASQPLKIIALKAVSFYAQLISVVPLIICGIPLFPGKIIFAAVRYASILILLAMACKIFSNKGIPTRTNWTNYFAEVTQSKEYITALLVMLLQFHHPTFFAVLAMMISIVINEATSIATKPKYIPDMILYNCHVTQFSRLVNREQIRLFQKRSDLLIYHGVAAVLSIMQTRSFITLLLYMTFVRLALLNRLYSLYYYESGNKLDQIIQYYVLSRTWCPTFVKTIYRSGAAFFRS